MEERKIDLRFSNACAGTSSGNVMLRPRLLADGGGGDGECCEPSSDGPGLTGSTRARCGSGTATLSSDPTELRLLSLSARAARADSDMEREFCRFTGAGAGGGPLAAAGLSTMARRSRHATLALSPALQSAGRLNKQQGCSTDGLLPRGASATPDWSAKFVPKFAYKT